mmetsp:Transcript_28758/g.82311  ORF Transcript_28758/g.82311 Transcript_28758/m.82311 type:complete len:253 (+) Transcript_28758:251-1009(+)
MPAPQWTNTQPPGSSSAVSTKRQTSEKRVPILTPSSSLSSTRMCKCSRTKSGSRCRSVETMERTCVTRLRRSSAQPFSRAATPPSQRPGSTWWHMLLLSTGVFSSRSISCSSRPAARIASIAACRAAWISASSALFVAVWRNTSTAPRAAARRSAADILEALLAHRPPPGDAARGFSANGALVARRCWSRRSWAQRLSRSARTSTPAASAAKMRSVSAFSVWHSERVFRQGRREVAWSFRPCLAESSSWVRR